MAEGISCDAAVVRAESYDEAEVYDRLKEAIDAVDGLSFVKPDMRVAVKANLMMPSAPDQAATVHPSVAKALCRLLTERGAEVVVGDSPGGPYAAAYLHAVYLATGMHAIESTGAKLNEDFSETEADNPAGVVLKSFPAVRFLEEADAVISLSKIKTHALMAYTGAVKNFYGAVPGLLKAEYHYRYPTRALFSNMLVDLAEHYRPVLSVADAIVGMEGNGPSAGRPKKMNALFVSKNPHVLDLAAASIMGLYMKDVPTLSAAHARGLVAESAEKLWMYGSLSDFIVPDFQRAVEQDVTEFGSRIPAVSALIRKLLACSPGIDKVKCIGCGKCMEICPAHAAGIKNGRAAVDKSKCIRCFCCQEFCPAGAISVHRPIVARLVSKRKL